MREDWVHQAQGMVVGRPAMVHHLWLFIHFLLLSSFLLSCFPQPAQPNGTISIYATPSAQPWMHDLFACANEFSILVNVTHEEPDIFLRIGEPEKLTSPAFQIGEEELFIVTHRESPIQNLSLEKAQALFAGQGDPSVQVWVYPSELDIQGLFDRVVMQGRSVAASAQVAMNPQQMSEVLNNESNAVGILPAHWKAGTVRVVYSLGVLPVLILTREEPSGAARDLISCLQK